MGTSVYGGHNLPPSPGWNRVKVAAKTWCGHVHMPTGTPDSQIWVWVLNKMLKIFFIFFFLRSTQLMIPIFDFRLPLQYSQSTTYYLLALIPVKSRLFPQRISTMVCKSICCSPYPATNSKTTNPNCFFSQKKLLTCW